MVVLKIPLAAKKGLEHRKSFTWAISWNFVPSSMNGHEQKRAIRLAKVKFSNVPSCLIIILPRIPQMFILDLSSNIIYPRLGACSGTNYRMKGAGSE